MTNPALSGQLGLRFRPSRSSSRSASTARSNGWYAEQTKRFRTGVFTAYLTGIFHVPAALRSA